MNNKKSIRPEIKGISTIKHQGPEEVFQNQVLRPVLKLQHNLLLLFFESHTLKKKVVFADLSALKKKAILDEIFEKDSQFKVELRGLILGQFTEEEFLTYQKMKPAINKRIQSMAWQRLLSTI